MYEDARLSQVATGIEKLVRGLLAMTHDRAPAPRPQDAAASTRAEVSGRARGSV